MGRTSAASPSGARLALQGSPSDLGEDPADLENGRRGIERQPRGQHCKLPRLGVSVERTLALASFEPAGLTRDQRGREVEEGRVAFRRGFLAELAREIGTTRVGRIALPKDRQRGIL